MQATVFTLVIGITLLGATNAWFFGWGRNDETTKTAVGGVDDACVALGQAGDCDFFDCFEQRFPCGRKWFVQSFGMHYCNRFDAARTTFTQAGQEFLAASQQCLTSALLDKYRSTHLNCHDLEHAAFANISSCYVSNGFCGVIGDNTDQFLEVFEVGDLFRRGAGKVWRQVFKIARECGGDAMGNLMREASSRLSPFMYRVLEGFNTLRDTIG